MLGRWQGEHGVRADRAFPGPGRLSSDPAARYRLREAKRRLRLTRERCKQAAAYVAHESS
jgi:hypothetical protein